eukprot:6519684-Alexandrium_andersonii.AAC.1
MFFSLAWKLAAGARVKLGLCCFCCFRLGDAKRKPKSEATANHERAHFAGCEGQGYLKASEQTEAATVQLSRRGRGGAIWVAAQREHTSTTNAPN